MSECVCVCECCCVGAKQCSTKRNTCATPCWRHHLCWEAFIGATTPSTDVVFPPPFPPSLLPSQAIEAGRSVAEREARVRQGLSVATTVSARKLLVSAQRPNACRATWAVRENHLCVYVYVYVCGCVCVWMETPIAVVL